MNSPFPGMDPFLERYWRSVHHRLITYIGDQLQELLPRCFRVEVEERVFVAGEADGGRYISPDAHVIANRKETQFSAPGALTACSPVIIEISDEPVTQAYLEIIDLTHGQQVVSAIELLSPTNKAAGDGNELYVRKQREYRMAGVNQIEIDLTRQGDRGLVFPMMRIPAELRATYMACVRRADAPMRLEVYPMPLDRPLPMIAVPLGGSNPDVALDLQQAVNACYQRGRYSDLDYRSPLIPSLGDADAEWMKGCLSERDL